MRSPLALATMLLLSSCAHWFGPAHGIVYLVGTTPGSTPCELTLEPVGGTDTGPRVVSGNFREHFRVSHSRKGHLAKLSCAGTVVSSRIFKYGRDVDIAGELALNGAAP
jgi:hypothetical protein